MNNKLLIVHWATQAWIRVITELIDSMQLVHKTQPDKWAVKQDVWEACTIDRLQDGIEELNKWM